MAAMPLLTTEYRLWVERLLKDSLLVWRAEEEAVCLRDLLARLVGLRPSVYSHLGSDGLGAAMWSVRVRPIGLRSGGAERHAVRLNDLLLALAAVWPAPVADPGPDVTEAGLANGQHSPVVYFVERDGLVKIGTTTKIDSRLERLHRGDAALPGMTISPVRLLAIMPGDRGVERSVHELFRSLRRGGEWFEHAEPLAGFVAAVSAAGHVPKPLSSRPLLAPRMAHHRHSSLAVADAARIRTRWPEGLPGRGAQRMLRAQLGWHAGKATNALRAYRDRADLNSMQVDER